MAGRLGSVWASGDPAVSAQEVEPYSAAPGPRTPSLSAPGQNAKSFEATLYPFRTVALQNHQQLYPRTDYARRFPVPHFEVPFLSPQQCRARYRNSSRLLSSSGETACSSPGGARSVSILGVHEASGSRRCGSGRKRLTNAIGQRIGRSLSRSARLSAPVSSSSASSGTLSS